MFGFKLIMHEMHTFHEDTIKVFIRSLRSNCPRFYRGGVPITDGLPVVITKKLTLSIGIVTWLFMHDLFTTGRLLTLLISCVLFECL
jgi:hypothetical protein